MRRTKPISVFAAVTLIPSAFLAGLWLRNVRPWETPVERAHRLCIACGLADSEVDRMIDDAGHSTLDRAGLLELWEGTFTEADLHKVLCRPCTLAVLDAGGHGGG